MSIFDSIANSVSSLFDGNFEGAWDSLSDISGETVTKYLGGAVKGYDALTKAKDKQNDEQRSLLGFIERNSRMQDTDQLFKSHPNEKYGAGNYSSDPAVIQRQWMSYLTGVADDKVVPGKRYDSLN